MIPKSGAFQCLKDKEGHGENKSQNMDIILCFIAIFVKKIHKKKLKL
jgi:hypothetical protein